MFDFPRETESGGAHINSTAVSESVRRLAARVPSLEARVREHGRPLSAMFDGQGGWSVIDALELGAAAAFLLRLDPETDYDAALVRQGLADRGYGHA